MRKIISLFPLTSTTLFAHPGHEHVGSSFHHIEWILLGVLAAGAGFAIWRVLGSKKE